MTEAKGSNPILVNNLLTSLKIKLLVDCITTEGLHR